MAEPMSCAEFLRILHDVPEAELNNLSEAIDKAWLAHIEECAACRAILETLEDEARKEIVPSRAFYLNPGRAPRPTKTPREEGEELLCRIKK